MSIFPDTGIPDAQYPDCSAQYFPNTVLAVRDRMVVSHPRHFNADCSAQISPFSAAKALYEKHMATFTRTLASADAQYLYANTPKIKNRSECEQFLDCFEVLTHARIANGARFYFATSPNTGSADAQ